MSFGLGSFGPSSYGGNDFVVENQIPTNGSVAVSRTPTISFSLESPTYITTSSINLTANSIPLIVNGSITSNAVGSINITNLNNVLVSITTTYIFGQLEVVNIVVSAQNLNNDTPTNNTWSFTTTVTPHTFTTYIMRAFQRVLRVSG